MSRSAIVLLALVLAAAVPAPASAQSQSEAGTLNCQLRPTIGLIIGSRQRMSCVFTIANTGRRETYEGRITRLGLDIGISAGGRMVWLVKARSPRLPPRALTGLYVGASGDIALGVGVGANALVGGSDKSVVLQPLSLEASVGVNLALGVAGLRLQ
jgi:hypothetical protein